MTKIIRTVGEMKQLRSRMTGQVGFVPTMGALHDGHVKLMTQSKQENNTTVASIFINPTQFNNKNDFETYPVTIDEDLKILNEVQVDYLFYPSYVDLYPDNFNFKISENNFSKILCGAFRPEHFNGVLTVVMKLFNIILPHKAYFGEKDYQQLLLVQKMSEAFFMNIEIIGVPTVRDENGLALSSRNARLSKDGKALAAQFAKILKKSKTKEAALRDLQKLNINIEYLDEVKNHRFAAVHVEGVRLIDNVQV